MMVPTGVSKLRNKGSIQSSLHVQRQSPILHAPSHEEIKDTIRTAAVGGWHEIQLPLAAARVLGFETASSWILGIPEDAVP
jgi:hypothetical protein